MRFDNKHILILIIVLTLLFLPLATLTTGFSRVILGILFVIVFPVYSLLSAVNPRRNDLGGLEQLALSFGISIAAVSVIGLILHYTIWGLGFHSILISTSIFIVIAAAIGYYRQARLKENECMSFSLIRSNRF